MNSKILMIVVAIAIAGAGFFGGMQYQKSKSSQSGERFAAFRQNNGQQQGRFNGQRPISGQIINADDKSITVKLRDGSSKIVILSGKTVINKSTDATKSDLVKDAQVMVIGAENSDGSVTAETISLNTMFREISGTPSAH